MIAFTPKTIINSASDFPSFCLEVAEQLEQQPIREEVAPHDRFVKKQYRTLVLSSRNLVMICEIFSRNIWYQTSPRGIDILTDYWSMEPRKKFLTIDDYIHTPNLPLELEQAYHEGIKPVLLKSLEIIFIEIFKKFTSNWVQIKVDENPSMKKNKAPDEFLLFTKKSSESYCLEESNLIRFIAKHLNIRDQIFEIDNEYSIPGNSLYLGNPYMWIKRDKIDELVERMGFRCLTDKFLAADILVTIVLYNDEYLIKKDNIVEDQIQFSRFFKITKGFPLELQMITANRLFGIAANFISSRYVKIALKQILIGFQ